LHSFHTDQTEICHGTAQHRFTLVRQIAYDSDWQKLVDTAGALDAAVVKNHRLLKCAIYRCFSPNKNDVWPDKHITGAVLRSKFPRAATGEGTLKF